MEGDGTRQAEWSGARLGTTRYVPVAGEGTGTPRGPDWGLGAPTRTAVGARMLCWPVRALVRPGSFLIKQPLQLPTIRHENLLAGLRPLVATNCLVTLVMMTWGWLR